MAELTLATGEKGNHQRLDIESTRRGKGHTGLCVRVGHDGAKEQKKSMEGKGGSSRSRRPLRPSP
jgi:hypothetical protein